jgi:hypothetical protein
MGRDSYRERPLRSCAGKTINCRNPDDRRLVQFEPALLVVVSAPSGAGGLGLAHYWCYGRTYGVQWKR